MTSRLLHRIRVMYAPMVVQAARSCWRLLLHILFPPFCTHCKTSLAEREALCVVCHTLIVPLVSKNIPLTSTGKMMSVYCVGQYHGPLQRLILAKSRSDKLACYYMAQLILQYTPIKNVTFDYIIPVPLHWTRYAKRGYNQAAEIAHELAKQTGVPLLHALKRVKRTPFQSRLSKEERKHNVHNAFVLSDDMRAQLKGKKILLVDDVMTTGATMRASARMLLVGRPLSVQAVVLART